MVNCKRAGCSFPSKGESEYCSLVCRDVDAVSPPPRLQLKTKQTSNKDHSPPTEASPGLGRCKRPGCGYFAKAGSGSAAEGTYCSLVCRDVDESARKEPVAHMGPLESLPTVEGAPEASLASEAAYYQSAEAALKRSAGDSYLQAPPALSHSALGSASPKSPKSKHALEVQLKEMAAREQLALSSLEGSRREAARSLELAQAAAEERESAAIEKVRLEAHQMLLDAEARGEAKLREVTRQMEREKAAAMNTEESASHQKGRVEELQRDLIESQAEANGYRNALERTQSLCKNFALNPAFQEATTKMNAMLDHLTSEVNAKSITISNLEIEARAREIAALRSELETEQARRRAAVSLLETERATFQETMATTSQEAAMNEENQSVAVGTVAKLEKEAAEMRIQLNENAAIVRKSQVVEELTVKQKVEITALKEQVVELQADLAASKQSVQDLESTIAKEREELQATAEHASKAKDQADLMYTSLQEALEANQSQSSVELSQKNRELERQLYDLKNELAHCQDLLSKKEIEAKEVAEENHRVMLSHTSEVHALKRGQAELESDKESQRKTYEREKIQLEARISSLQDMLEQSKQAHKGVSDNYEDVLKTVKASNLETVRSLEAEVNSLREDMRHLDQTASSARADLKREESQREQDRVNHQSELETAQNMLEMEKANGKEYHRQIDALIDEKRELEAMNMQDLGGRLESKDKMLENEKRRRKEDSEEHKKHIAALTKTMEETKDTYATSKKRLEATHTKEKAALNLKLQDLKTELDQAHQDKERLYEQAQELRDAISVGAKVQLERQMGAKLSLIMVIALTRERKRQLLRAWLQNAHEAELGEQFSVIHRNRAGAQRAGYLMLIVKSHRERRELVVRAVKNLWTNYKNNEKFIAVGYAKAELYDMCEENLYKVKQGGIAMMRGLRTRLHKFAVQRAVTEWSSQMRFEQDLLHVYNLEMMNNAATLGVLGTIFGKWRAQAVQRIVLRWKGNCERHRAVQDVGESKELERWDDMSRFSRQVGAAMMATIFNTWKTRLVARLVHRWHARLVADIASATMGNHIHMATSKDWALQNFAIITTRWMERSVSRCIATWAEHVKYWPRAAQQFALVWRRMMTTSAVRCLQNWRETMLDDIMHDAIEREHTLLLHEQLNTVQSNLKQMESHYAKQEHLENMAQKAEAAEDAMTRRLLKGAGHRLATALYTMLEQENQLALTTWREKVNKLRRGKLACKAALLIVTRGEAAECISSWRHNLRNHVHNAEIAELRAVMKARRIQERVTQAIGSLLRHVDRDWQRQYRETLGEWRRNYVTQLRMSHGHRVDALINSLVVSARVKGLDRLGCAMEGWLLRACLRAVAHWKRNMVIWSSEAEAEDARVAALQAQMVIDNMTAEKAIRRFNALLMQMLSSELSQCVNRWYQGWQASGAAATQVKERNLLARKLLSQRKANAVLLFASAMRGIRKAALTLGVVSWRQNRYNDALRMARIRGEDELMDAQLSSQRHLDEFTMEAALWKFQHILYLWRYESCSRAVSNWRLTRSYYMAAQAMRGLADEGHRARDEALQIENRIGSIRIMRSLRGSYNIHVDTKSCARCVARWKLQTRAAAAQELLVFREEQSESFNQEASDKVRRRNGMVQLRALFARYRFGQASIRISIWRQSAAREIRMETQYGFEKQRRSEREKAGCVQIRMALSRKLKRSASVAMQQWRQNLLWNNRQEQAFDRHMTERHLRQSSAAKLLKRALRGGLSRMMSGCLLLWKSNFDAETLQQTQAQSAQEQYETSIRRGLWALRRASCGLDAHYISSLLEMWKGRMWTSQYIELLGDMKHTQQEAGARHLIYSRSVRLFMQGCGRALASWRYNLSLYKALALDEWKQEQQLLEKLALAQRMAREAEREWAIEHTHKEKVAPMIARALYKVRLTQAAQALEEWQDAFLADVEHRRAQAMVVAGCMIEGRKNVMLNALTEWIEAYDAHHKRVHSLGVIRGVLQRWTTSTVAGLLQRWRHRGFLTRVLARFGAGLRILQIHFDFERFRGLVRATLAWRGGYLAHATRKAALERGSVLQQFQVKCAKLALAPRANSAAWRAIRNWQAAATQAIVVEELTSVMQDIFVHSLSPGELQQAGNGTTQQPLDVIATRAIGQAIGMQAGVARHVGDASGVTVNAMQQALAWRKQSKLLWIILRWKQRQANDRASYEHESATPQRAQAAVADRAAVRGDRPPSPIGKAASPLGPRRRAHMPAVALDLKAATAPGGASPSWEAMGAEFAELAALGGPPPAGEKEPPKVSPRLSPRPKSPREQAAGGKSWSKVRRKGSYVPGSLDDEPPSTGSTPAPPSRTRVGSRRKSQVQLEDESAAEVESPLNKLPDMAELEKWASANPEDIKL